MSWRSRERFHLESIAILDHRPHTSGVSELPFDGHGDHHHEAGCRYLLEMHKVRRRVERGAGARESVPHAAMAMRRGGTFQAGLIETTSSTQPSAEVIAVIDRGADAHTSPALAERAA
jgi:hypothetical protein